MDFITATQSYEAWLAKQMKLDREGLRRKHVAMAADEFSFMRATYYRWAQLIARVCAEEYDTPEVMSVGDLHVENFGTWRDAEGRLVWGINDFDEAVKLPYSNDLIRLSLSARLALRSARRAESVWADASAAILVGYSDRMRRVVEEGMEHIHPIVLAETNHWLAKIATHMLHDPKEFWDRLDSELGEGSIKTKNGGQTWRRLLLRVMPKGSSEITLHRRYAGLGSLGRPRYVAMARWNGSRIAREAKALAAPAATWAKVTSTQRINYDALLDRSVRSRDPYAIAEGNWILRRLAPDCARILFDSLPDNAEMDLFYAMGEETANVHLAGPKAAGRIVADLESRRGDWLAQPVNAMLDALHSDYLEWVAFHAANETDHLVDGDAAPGEPVWDDSEKQPEEPAKDDRAAVAPKTPTRARRVARPRAVPAAATMRRRAVETGVDHAK